MTTKIYTDGASRGNPGRASGGVVVGSVKFGVCFEPTTNNIAEYRALIYALKEATLQKLPDIEIFSDSLLMVNQINRKWEVKDGDLRELWIVVQHFLRHNFDSWTITHIPREENTEADRLANEALDKECK